MIWLRVGGVFFTSLKISIWSVVITELNVEMTPSTLHLSENRCESDLTCVTCNDFHRPLSTRTS